MVKQVRKHRVRAHSRVVNGRRSSVKAHNRYQVEFFVPGYGDESWDKIGKPYKNPKSAFAKARKLGVERTYGTRVVKLGAKRRVFRVA